MKVLLKRKWTHSCHESNHSHFTEFGKKYTILIWKLPQNEENSSVLDDFKLIRMTFLPNINCKIICFVIAIR